MQVPSVNALKKDAEPYALADAASPPPSLREMTLPAPMPSVKPVA